MHSCLRFELRRHISVVEKAIVKQLKSAVWCREVANVLVRVLWWIKGSPNAF
jgi:hypothetical protein